MLSNEKGSVECNQLVEVDALTIGPSTYNTNEDAYKVFYSM